MPFKKLITWGRSQGFEWLRWSGATGAVLVGGHDSWHIISSTVHGVNCFCIYYCLGSWLGSMGQSQWSQYFWFFHRTSIVCSKETWGFCTSHSPGWPNQKWLNFVKGGRTNSEADFFMFDPFNWSTEKDIFCCKVLTDTCLSYDLLLKKPVKKWVCKKSVAKRLYGSFALEDTVTYPYFKHTALIMILYNLQRKELGQKWLY